MQNQNNYRHVPDYTNLENYVQSEEHAEIALKRFMSRCNECTQAIICFDKTNYPEEFTLLHTQSKQAQKAAEIYALYLMEFHNWTLSDLSELYEKCYIEQWESCWFYEFLAVKDPWNA